MTRIGTPAQLHRADLHRRRVRAQQPPVAEIEGVVHRARRMVGGNVERLEVVEVVLDFRPFRELNPALPEDRLDAQARARHGMQAADGLPATGQRDVDRAGRELA